MSVVLITGCGSGFGEAIAVAFAKGGDRVVASMRRPDAAPPSLTQLTGAGAVAIVPLDVTDPGARQHAIDFTVNRFGRLDILVNSAGMGASGSMEDMPEAAWQKVFATNFFGPLELMRCALPVMRRQGAGRIVNITSVAALVSTPLLSAYSASKQALDAVSTALDVESRSFGVRVASVISGPFKTGLAAKSLDIAPSPPYAGIHGNFRSLFSKLEAEAPGDLSPVVRTVIAAATDTDPSARYVVGAHALGFLPNILQALSAVREFGLHLTGQR